MVKINLAIVGATGAVGRTMLQVLAEQSIEVNRLYLLASSKSAGLKIGSHIVQDLEGFDFRRVDYALFSAGSAVSTQYVPQAVECGCVVIDNTSCFRYDNNVPLIIPEVNISAFRGQMLIANPNCSTIQMLVALKPLYDAVGIEKIIVSTYQAVSGAGQAALDEFDSEISMMPLALNVVPQIDVIQDNGYSREEMKMAWETKKILNDPAIKVSATCVRVPVINAHGEAISIQTRQKISAQQAVNLMQAAPGVVVQIDGYQLQTAATGQDEVFVSRVREDLALDNGISMWVVADNLRKGAATNAVQILKSLI